jgi:predicted small secreted protein
MKLKQFIAPAVLAICALAVTIPAAAQRMTPEENAQRSSKAAKQQAKMLKKANKKQRKASKKYAKKQAKETAKANRQLQKSRGR